MVNTKFIFIQGLNVIIFLSGAISAEFQHVNVLLINELNNSLASQGIDQSLNYIQKNPNLGLSVNVMKINGNYKRSTKFLEAICSRIDQSIIENQPPHIMIDATITGTYSEIVKSVGLALALPTISGSIGGISDQSIWLHLTEEQKQFLFQVISPTDLIPKVIRSIVQYMNITNAAILYDQTFPLESQSHSLLSNQSVRHVVAKISPSDQQKQLDQLRNFDINHFFILGNLSSISRVLGSARSEYFKRNFVWFAITQSNGHLCCNNCDNATIIFLRPVTNGTDIMTAFYFDIALRAFLSIKDMLLHGSWPINMKHLSCMDFNGTNTPKRGIELKSVFRNSSGRISLNYQNYMKFDMDITAVSIRNGITIEQRLLGRWTAGLNNPITIRRVRDIEDLKATVIYRVYTVIQAPFVMRDPSAPKGYKGYCIDMIDEIGQILNFDYEIKHVEDGQFGEMDDNGKWNGLIRKLIDREADIGLGSISFMSERENVVDFTIPYYDPVGIGILLSLPKSQGNILKFVAILEPYVWFSILGAYLFSSFLIWFYNRCSPYSFRNTGERYLGNQERFTMKESLWFCYTAFTPQGGGVAPRNLSGRVVTATWWIFGFITIASYTANLAAVLTVSQLEIETPIETLEDLYAQYKIQYAAVNESSATTYFKRMSIIGYYYFNIWVDLTINKSKTPLENTEYAIWDHFSFRDYFSKMWQAMQETGLPDTFEECVDRVKNSTDTSGFACIADATDIRYELITNCDLQMASEERSKRPYAIALQDGSLLKEQFDDAILRLMNDGKLEALKEKWWNPNEHENKCGKLNESIGISLNSLTGVFTIIWIGISVAIVTLICEYLWFRCHKKLKLSKIDTFDTVSGELEPGTDKLMLAEAGIKKWRNRVAIRRRNLEVIQEL